MYPKLRFFDYEDDDEDETNPKSDEFVKSPKFRHACEGRHPELFENTGFPPSRE
jgi:hypothetical protein